jgi:hypothetical protein
MPAVPAVRESASTLPEADPLALVGAIAKGSIPPPASTPDESPPQISPAPIYVIGDRQPSAEPAACEDLPETLAPPPPVESDRAREPEARVVEEAPRRGRTARLLLCVLLGIVIGVPAAERLGYVHVLSAPWARAPRLFLGIDTPVIATPAVAETVPGPAATLANEAPSDGNATPSAEGANARRVDSE